MIFSKGQRVRTRLGEGSVVYVRLRYPDYQEAEAYSVCLDSKKALSEQPPFPNYTGTIFAANEVFSL